MGAHTHTAHTRMHARTPARLIHRYVEEKKQDPFLHTGKHTLLYTRANHTHTHTVEEKKYHLLCTLQQNTFLQRHTKMICTSTLVRTL